MKEELKNIFLMGLGAISLTGEKASQLKDELLTKGEALYQDGMVKNEELKREIKEKIKDSVTVEIKKTDKDDIISAIKEMNSVEKKEILNLLKEETKQTSKEIKIKATSTKKDNKKD